jgi:septal ring factor EnvC (AmiA/AmiB activator)
MPLLDMSFAAAPVEQAVMAPESTTSTTDHSPTAPESATAGTGDPERKRYDDNQDWAQRYAHLRSASDKQKKEFETRIAELEKTITNLSAALKSDGASDKDIQKAQKEIAQKEAREKVLRRFPDAIKIRHSEQFNTWLEAQTKKIKGLLASDDADDVISVLELYTARVNQNGSRVEASLGVDLPNAKEHLPPEKKIWTASEINKMPLKQFAKYKDEILKARKEGRYDPNR